MAMQDPPIENLWKQDTRIMMFWVFNSLCQLLYLYQALVQYAAWEPNCSIKLNASCIIIDPTTNKTGDSTNVEGDFSTQDNLSSPESGPIQVCVDQSQSDVF